MLAENNLALVYIERLLSLPTDFISREMLLSDPDRNLLMVNSRFREILDELGPNIQENGEIVNIYMICCLCHDMK